MPWRPRLLASGVISIIEVVVVVSVLRGWYLSTSVKGPIPRCLVVLSMLVCVVHDASAQRFLFRPAAKKHFRYISLSCKGILTLGVCLRLEGVDGRFSQALVKLGGIVG